MGSARSVARLDNGRLLARRLGYGRGATGVWLPQADDIVEHDFEGAVLHGVLSSTDDDATGSEPGGAAWCSREVPPV